MNLLLPFALLFLSAQARAAGALDFDQGRLDVAPFLQAPAPQARWTVMAYVNGKNDLERFALQNVNAMEAAGSTPEVNVVVEMGRRGKAYGSDPVWSGVRRYLIKKDSDPGRITSPVLADMTADMGDANHLLEFARWARTAYPAEHTLLIVWDHGTGWLMLAPEPATKGISYDYVTRNHISTLQLGEVLSQLGHLDIYASDACRMQMASVAYELRGHADYIVGSEHVEPGDGYPYEAILAGLTAKPGSSPEDLARLIVRSYRDYYEKAGFEAVTQSALRGPALPGFLERLNRWADLAMASGEKAVVRSALTSALQFRQDESRDLAHIVELVNAGTSREDLRRAGQELSAFLERELIAANGVYGEAFRDAHGLAVYVPNSSYAQDYSRLSWARDSRWDELLRWALDL